MARFFRTCCVLLPIGFLTALVSTDGRGEEPPAFTLEIDAANPKGGTMEVFYDIGRDYSHLDWAACDLPATAELSTYRFRLAVEPLWRIRIDPAQGGTVMTIGAVRLIAPTGAILMEWGPESLAIMNQIDSIEVLNGEAVITIPDGVRDPMIYLRDPPAEISIRWLDRTLVSRTAITAMAFFALAACLMGGWGAFTVLVPSGVPAPGRPGRATTGLATLAAFLFVFGVRLATLHQFSDPVPVGDEWHADLHFLILPFQDGYLDWATLFELQNEHRILFTRIISLTAFMLSGEFDPRIGMWVGALLWSALIALVCAGFYARTSPRWFWITVPFWIVAALPFDPANMFWGGQSQMYALIYCATCILALAATARPTRTQVVAAAGLSIVSLFTMGSGFIAPLMAAGLVLLRIPLQRDQWRIRVGFASVFATIASVGPFLYARSPRFAPTYADSISEFWQAFVGYASWPLAGHTAAILVVWLPWIVLTVILLRRLDMSKRTVLGWFGFALGCWILIHAIGLGYSRPELDSPHTPRYFTPLFINSAAAFCAVGFIWTSKSRWTVRIPLFCLLSLSLLSMGRAGFVGIETLRNLATQHAIYQEVIENYVSTGRRESLADLRFYHTPFWNSNELAARLDAPEMVRVLPYDLRRHARSVEPESERGIHGPGIPTQVVLRFMQNGWVFAGMSLFLLAAVSCRGKPRVIPSTHPSADKL